MTDSAQADRDAARIEREADRGERAAQMEERQEEREATQIEREAARLERRDFMEELEGVGAQLQRCTATVVALKQDYHNQRQIWQVEALSRHNDLTRMKRILVLAAEEWTPEQLEAIKPKLEAQKINLTEFLTGELIDPTTDPKFAASIGDA